MVRHTILDRIGVEEAIYRQIDDAWAETGAWPGFIKAMRQSLSASSGGSSAGAKQPSWIHLVGLCCKAAGGDERITHKAAAAWGLLYTAAHLLDSLQDGDLPDPWWEPLGPGVATNVATGLIFSASHLLDRLVEDGVTMDLTQRVAQDFSRTILQMCSGQDADLRRADPSLEQAWRIAEAKSGAFFALACRVGATIASIDDDRIEHYSTFGSALGLMIQIGDDIRDLAQDAAGCLAAVEQGRWSLPVAYFMDTATKADQDGLRSLSANPQHANRLKELIDGSGAHLYLAAKAEHQRLQALNALALAGAGLPAKEELEQLLDQATYLHSSSA